jgi:thiol-disulfide isomerase/thioredoxin
MNRQNLPVILSAFLVVLLLVAYFFKGNLNDFISRKMQESAGHETLLSGQQWVDSLFNYTKNKEDFEFTLLQFKSTGCSLCRQMEPELKMLENDQVHGLNIVVLNIMNANSQEVMKYFGIATVPAHVILNKEGKEIFRRYGFVSALELKSQFVH